MINKPSHKMFSVCIEYNEITCSIPSVAKCIDCIVCCLSLRTDVKNSEIEIKKYYIKFKNGYTLYSLMTEICILC